MAIPDSIIDQVQEKVDIVEVISRHIPLKKLGRNYKALCPFHNEKTPSFVVSPDKQIYHCFGCGAGGNVFSFLMRYENIEFPEAVETLASKAGIAIPRTGGQRKELTSLANQLYAINELACQFFSASLTQNKAGREYLASRGIGEETARAFKLGLAPDSWDGLLGFLKKKGISEISAEKAGLAIKNSERGTYYDRFRKRVIFPISDIRERVLGFGARVLDASLPKYINSPETYIYSKGKNLYGLNLSKEQIKREGYTLIVEGYLDFIVPYQAGVKNIVATLGTALTVDQIKLLKRFAGTVIMVYDPDEAGEAASLRNLDLFITEGVNVYIAELPAGFDPDGYIRKFGAEEFTGLVKSAKNLFEYKFDKLKGRVDIRSIQGKAKVVGEMLPTISKIQNAVVRSDLVKKLAERLSLDEESIRTELKKVKPDYAESRYTAEIAGNSVATEATAEKMVLAILLEGEKMVGRAKESLSPDEFRDQTVRDSVKAVFDLYDEKGAITPAKVISYLDNSPAAAALISEAVNISEVLEDKERTLADCIARIKRDNIKERLGAIQTAIKAAHDLKDEEGVRKLVVEYNDLVKISRG